MHGRPHSGPAAGAQGGAQRGGKVREMVTSRTGCYPGWCAGWPPAHIVACSRRRCTSGQGNSAESGRASQVCGLCSTGRRAAALVGAQVGRRGSRHTIAGSGAESSQAARLRGATLWGTAEPQSRSSGVWTPRPPPNDLQHVHKPQRALPAAVELFCGPHLACPPPVTPLAKPAPWRAASVRRYAIGAEWPGRAAQSHHSQRCRPCGAPRVGEVNHLTEVACWSRVVWPRGVYSTTVTSCAVVCALHRTATYLIKSQAAIRPRPLHNPNLLQLGRQNAAEGVVGSQRGQQG